MSHIDFESLEKGQVVVERDIDFTRDRLVRYAGASGDFNPIHYRDDVATGAGLDGVLAHGMLTMGAVTSPVAEWASGSGIMMDVQSRFTRPVVVDPEHGARVAITGTIGAIDVDARTARVDIRAVVDGKPVLTKAQVVVQF